MEYSLHKLSLQQMKEFLDLYPVSFLRGPIVKNAKKFGPKAKGFRLSSLMMERLYHIYFDEIHGEDKTPLEIFLLDSIAKNFEETEIDRLLEEFDGDLELLIIQLEKEVLKANLWVSPSIIIEMSAINLEKPINGIFREFHQLVVAEKARARESAINETGKKWEKDYKKLQIENVQLSDNLGEALISRNNMSKKMKELEKEKNETIASLVDEKKIIVEKNNELQLVLASKENKMHDMTKRVESAERQAQNNGKLREEISSLETIIQELKERALTPEKIKDMCQEVVEDLTSEGIGRTDLMRVASELFSKELKVNEAWDLLSTKEKENIEKITDKMAGNSITSSEIDILDDIENYICIKYMIIKSMKAIFYKYLEQNVLKETIKQSIFNH